jgi:hypothetical protein
MRRKGGERGGEKRGKRGDEERRVEKSGEEGRREEGSGGVEGGGRGQCYSRTSFRSLLD